MFFAVAPIQRVVWISTRLRDEDSLAIGSGLNVLPMQAGGIKDVGAVISKCIDEWVTTSGCAFFGSQYVCLLLDIWAVAFRALGHGWIRYKRALSSTIMVSSSDNQQGADSDILDVER